MIDKEINYKNYFNHFERNKARYEALYKALYEAIKECETEKECPFVVNDFMFNTDGNGTIIWERFNGGAGIWQSGYGIYSDFSIDGDCVDINFSDFVNDFDDATTNGNAFTSVFPFVMHR